MIEFSLKEYDFVELKNLLKILDLTQTGGHTKLVIQGGEVKLNDEVETRRGKKLYVGDKIQYLEHTIMIIA